MKTFFIINFIVFVFQSTYSQPTNHYNNNGFLISDTNRAVSVSSKSIELDPVYFVLGTLSDYMGRFQYIERENQVDKYYMYEKPLLKFMTEYIESNLNIEVDTTFENKMYSEQLSKILNNFYGKHDELITGKFENNKQAYSFLTGFFYRYGDKLDTTVYKIQLANSPKHQNCYDLLKQIGCEKIFSKYLRNFPAQYILYFEPTHELRKYMDLIESERLILQESFKDQTEELMKEQMSKEELEKVTYKYKNEESEKIKNAFEK